jgi:hypothetical protein
MFLGAAAAAVVGAGDDVRKAATFRRLHHLDRFLAEAVRFNGDTAHKPRALNVNAGMCSVILQLK